MSNNLESAQQGFVVAAKTNDIAEGSMVGLTVAANQILLSRIGGKFYATDAICSHFYGYLPKGALKENIVICPVHKAEYNVHTGKVVKNVNGLLKLATGRQATDLRIYEVRLAGDSILIKV